MASAVTSSCPSFVPLPILASQPLLSTGQLGESLQLHRTCLGIELTEKNPINHHSNPHILEKRQSSFPLGQANLMHLGLGWPQPFQAGGEGGLARPSWPAANSASHTWLHGSSHCSSSDSAAAVRRTELKRDWCTHIGGCAGGPSQSEAEARLSPPSS